MRVGTLAGGPSEKKRFGDLFRELREELSGKTKDLAENGEPVFVEAQRSQVTCPFYSAAEQHSMCLNPGSI